MQWYLRHEDGEIWGPMSQQEAQDMRDRLDDSVMFSEELFAQTVVLSEEVTSVLAGLRELQRILVRGLWGKDADIREFDLSQDELQKAIDVITNLSREKVVTGSIEGGVLSLGEVSEGVTVDIRDFDVEGVDPELVEEDENGDTYFQVC